MGFRFQKRISILPGISINLGKNGASMSVGPRGFKTTIGSRGIKHSYGIPGTGIRYETPYKKIGNGNNTGGIVPAGDVGGYSSISLWQKIKEFFNL